MKDIYNNILSAKFQLIKLLAILLDPDKLDLDKIPELVSKINKSPATHILVGGSSFEGNNLNELIIILIICIKLNNCIACYNVITSTTESILREP